MTSRTGYIYVITNLINGKQYVGKTYSTIEKRFKEHIRDSRKGQCQHRPLYKAMKKYGVENFIIELLEKTDNLEKREAYWIKKLNTYGKKGYNATLGGDGNPRISSQEIKKIILLYKEKQNIREIAKITNHDVGWIRRVLRINKIPIKKSGDVTKEKCSKEIYQYTKDNIFICKFDSIMEAGRYIASCLDMSYNPYKHIAECAHNRRKTAYGYIWKFV